MEFHECYLCGVDLLKGNGGSLSGREGFPGIPPLGGFRKLRSFQCAQVVYDGTVIFCNRFIDKKSRSYDQMVQAAGSGVQNIAEGSMASATWQQLKYLEKEFLRSGGFTELRYNARKSYRNNQ